MNMLHTDYVT